MNILVAIPHPDDAAYCAAGTLARWVEEGHQVTIVCCTSGNMGTLKIGQSADEIAQIRANELLASNRIIGVAHTEFLGFPDGCLLDPAALRKELVRCVRQFRPDRLMTMDPWVNYEVHRDHQVVSQMAAEAAAFAGFPLLHPEQLAAGLAPHHADEVWFMGILGKRPNTFVSISDQLTKKAEALLQFEASLFIIEQLLQSEGADNTGQQSLDVIKSRIQQWIGDQATMFGKPVNLPAAEAFLVQTCMPGHFGNFPEIYAEMLGLPPAKPKVWH